jgi:phospholipid/cholesterol/gamma-HCH transport system permease protein
LPHVTSLAMSVDDHAVHLRGDLHVGEATRVWETLRSVSRRAGDHFDIDLGGVESVDGATIALLVACRDRLVREGVRSELVNTPESVAPLLALYRGATPSTAPSREDVITRFGRITSAALDRLASLVAFLGEAVHSLVRFIRNRKATQWREFTSLLDRAATDGVPIVALLNFLIGFVVAFQLARSLQRFGANIYVADIVGVGLTRELAPLMTAIIVAGRSGAAYAAEIGTMRVSEEIDALRTLGIAPVPYLVVPRVFALAIAAPLLTLLGNVVGVIGGGVIAVATLGLSADAYVAEIGAAVGAADVWTGLAKSVGFGATIAFIGCRAGFATRGSAAGVGRSTTYTVVASLFMIVVLDTLFSLLLRSFGL